MTGKSGDAISLDELAERGASGTDADWEQRYDSVGPDDICTFIYTSGTTGPPKGCVISHGNYRSMLDMVHAVSVLGDDEVTYLFLPLAHSFALLIQLGTFDLGATLAYWERDPLKILPNLSEVKPTYFPSVPRIFEKIYTAATAAVEKEGGLKKTVFDWAIGVGKKVRRLEREGKRPGPLLRLQHSIADKQVLSKIRALFGGNLKLAVTGAAPINPEILRVLRRRRRADPRGLGHDRDLDRGDDRHPGGLQVRDRSASRSPAVEVKIADDGEILVKGPNVFQGYYKNDGGDRARRSSTAGCTPATSASSTPTAT